MDKKLKTNLVIIAENKGVSQKELLENYIKKGIEEDKKYLTSHLEQKNNY